MKPIPVDDVLMVFPGTVDDYMVDESLHVERNSDLGNLASSIFYNPGQYGFCARDGVDAEKAWRHIAVIMGSFAPKHERKIGTTGYLLGHWFHTVIRYDDEAKTVEKSTIAWQDKETDDDRN